MGHIRLGRIPKTRQWKEVFLVLGEQDADSASLAGAVASAAHDRLDQAKRDPALSYCFWVLVRLATSSRSGSFEDELRRLGIKTERVTSALNFLAELSQSTSLQLRQRRAPTILAELAQSSLRETLSGRITDKSETLFGTSLAEIKNACRSASSRAQFGLIAREFFGQFLSKFVRYVADKEISNHVGPRKTFSSPQEVLQFQDAVEVYCRQSTKVLEEFAAGWFSKHNWETNNDISEQDAKRFTAYALKKLQLEFEERVDA